jgi:hypothetical protein
MRELALTPQLVIRMQAIYAAMEDDYNRVAEALHFGCAGCPDNCCDSYFLHHTYAEWAYLWLGMRRLPESVRNRILIMARQYLERCAEAELRGERPQVMCPLNEGGMCQLYAHRMMVCRTHGVPASMRRPDGQELNFPGCFRCQEIVVTQKTENLPRVDRTPLLRQLVLVENELLRMERHLYPKVKMSIAEMLVQGPPVVAENDEK